MISLEFIRDNRKWLGAGALLTFLSSFGQTFFISLFAGEIQAEFDLTEGQWSRIYGVGTMVSAIIMVRAGALTDSYRTRSLGVFVLGGLAVACLAMAFNPIASGLILVILLLRLFGQGMASHTAVVAMSRWFVATRGRALAISTLGFTCGEMLLPISFVALMGFVDWRVLWIVAAFVALLGIPLLSTLLREERHPKQVAEETQALGMDATHWNRRQVLRHPLFWLMIPALLGPSAFNTAFFFYHVLYADVIGWSHLELVFFFPIYTSMGIVAMILSGIAVDRWGSARTMPLYQLPMIASFVCFAFGGSTSVLLLGFFFLAATSGANSTIPNAFWAEFYGTRYIGSIKAMASAVMVLGSAIGPALIGVFLDFGVELRTQYFFVAGFFGLTTLLMWVGITRYRDRLRYT